MGKSAPATTTPKAADTGPEVVVSSSTPIDNDTGPSSLPSEAAPPARSPSPPASVHTTHSQPPPPYVRPVAASTPNRTGAAGVPTPRPAYNAREHHRNTLIIRGICFVIALIGWVFFLAVLLVSDWADAYNDIGTGFVAALGLGGLSYSLVACFIMGTSDLILLRHGKDPIPPGLPLTFDLLGWMGVFIIAVFCGLFAYPYSDSNSGAEFMTHGERVGIAFAVFAAILHFCLFVTACKDIHRQRKEIKDMKATLRAYVEMT